MNTRIISAIIISMLSGNVVAGPFIEIGKSMSDKGVEGMVDTRFDHRLFELGRSTSEHLFSDSHNNSGLVVALGYDTDAIEIKASLSNSSYSGACNLGEIHTRRDSITVSAMGKYSVFGITMMGGAYATYEDVTAHSWLDSGEEYHDEYRDFSAGPAIGASYEVYGGVSINASMYFNQGDVDSVGKSTVTTIGIRHSF